MSDVHYSPKAQALMDFIRNYKRRSEQLHREVDVCTTSLDALKLIFAYKQEMDEMMQHLIHITMTLCILDT